jgi:quercetin dioxygenase-like cupin family protein
MAVIPGSNSSLVLFAKLLKPTISRVFRYTCDLLQKTIAEATIKAVAHENRFLVELDRLRMPEKGLFSGFGHGIAKTWEVRMVYSTENGTTVYEQGGCKGVRLYEAEGNEYVHLSIESGGGIPEHSLPLAVSFCVLKGRGTCTVSGRDFSVGAGEMIECPAGDPRGWTNNADEILEILVIKRAVS